MAHMSSSHRVGKRTEPHLLKDKFVFPHAPGVEYDAYRCDVNKQEAYKFIYVELKCIRALMDAIAVWEFTTEYDECLEERDEEYMIKDWAESTPAYAPKSNANSTRIRFWISPTHRYNNQRYVPEKMHYSEFTYTWVSMANDRVNRTTSEEVGRLYPDGYYEGAKYTQGANCTQPMQFDALLWYDKWIYTKA